MSASSRAAATPAPTIATRIGRSAASARHQIRRRHRLEHEIASAGARAQQQRPVAVLLEPEEPLRLERGQLKLRRQAVLGRHAGRRRRRRRLHDEQVAQDDRRDVVWPDSGSRMEPTTSTRFPRWSVPARSWVAFPASAKIRNDPPSSDGEPLLLDAAEPPKGDLLTAVRRLHGDEVRELGDAGQRAHGDAARPAEASQ